MKKLLLSILCLFTLSSCGGVTPIPLSTAAHAPSVTSAPVAAKPARSIPAAVKVTVTHPELEVITPENVQRIQLIERWGKGKVYGVELSPDGSLIAVATSTGVYLYDRLTTEQVGFVDLPIAADFKPDECNLQEKNISFSPDGKFLAVADTDIRIWDLNANKLSRTIVNQVDDPASIVAEVKFSPDGSRLVTLQKHRYMDYLCYLGWRSFLIYDAHSGEKIFRQDFQGNDEFPGGFQFGEENTAYFYADGLSKARGWTVSKVDLSNGAVLGTDSFDTNHLISLSGSFMSYSTSKPDTGEITSHFIDLESGKEIRTIDGWTVVFPNFPYVFVEKDDLSLETVEGNKICSFSKGNGPSPWFIKSFTYDHKLGISWDDNTAEIRIWDLEKCEISEPILDFHEFGREMEFSPDGISLLANNPGGYGYYVLDTQSGHVRYTVQPGDIYEVYEVEFSAGGKKVAVYGKDAIAEYDAITGSPEGELFDLEMGWLGGFFRFNPNGSSVIYGDRGSAVLRSTLGDKRVIRYDFTGSSIFSDDGNTLITFAWKNGGTEVSFLNLITGEETKAVGLIPETYPWSSQAVNRDLSYLVSLDSYSMYLWALPDLHIEKVLVPRSFSARKLTGPVLFSPDSRLVIAVGHGPSQIMFWDVETGQLVHTFPTLETALEMGYLIDISPDGRLLATLGGDGVIRIWGVKK